MTDSKTKALDTLWQVRSETQRETQARAEHLKVISRHSIFIVLGNLVGSATLVFGLWNSIESYLLVTWLFIVMVLSVIRWSTGHRFPTGVIGDTEIQRRERLFAISVTISGALWGAAGILFYLPNQAEYVLFLALVIVGMCAAATASLSYHRFAYPVFVVVAISPITIQLMSHENFTINAVGFVIPFYFTLLYLLSREIYQTAHESILSRLNSQYQAMFDHLTGVANRRAFEKTMEREWHRAERDRHCLALIIADIDDFKSYNDTHGHATGDLVLKAVAILFEKRIRRGADLVARIGGEEFAVILPDTDLNGAVALAESIRNGLRELPEELQNEIYRVTMSFGVSSLIPESSIDSMLLFNHADAAAYLAKGRGKNRIETMGAS